MGRVDREFKRRFNDAFEVEKRSRDRRSPQGPGNENMAATLC